MIRTKLILERFDKDYRLLEKRERVSRSFLLQFIELLYCAHAQIQQVAPYVMTDVDGNPQDIDSDTDNTVRQRGMKANLQVGSSAGYGRVLFNVGIYGDYSALDWHALEADMVGIQVGTGVVAVTSIDYALGTRIVNGSGPGEFEYGGCDLLYMVIADPNGEFTIRRYFTNNSGGGITVEEVGIYAVGTEWDNSAARHVWPFCITRDLTGGVAVADTEILRVTYVPQITV